VSGWRGSDARGVLLEARDTLKKYYSGWRCYLFSGDTRLPKLIRLSASRRTPLYNGPLECRLYEYRIVTGSNRQKAAPEIPGAAAG